MRKLQVNCGREMLARGTLDTVPCREATDRRRTHVTVQAIGCHHCQRAVQPTVHGRRGATVDYYRTVTGAGRRETHEDSRSGMTVRVTRVEHLIQLNTCVDCWKRPDVQAALETLRRTGEMSV